MLTWDQVSTLVRSAAAEDESIEFKGAFWPEKPGRPRSEEIAKDVAAFLNHRGGAIIVGVGAAGERAGGFSDAPLPERADQMVMQALERHLVPQPSAGAVYVRVLAGQYEGSMRQVLAVEVRGWPHGPVAVRTTEGLYRLPARRGAHTENISWEEAMRDLTSTHRRDWLRFREWQERYPKLGVFIGTGVRTITMEGRSMPVPLLIEEPFAHLKAVDLDVVHLTILRTVYVRWVVAANALKPLGSAVREAIGEPWFSLLGGAGARDAWGNSMPLDLAVPFELIRAAWVESVANVPRLHLLLDGDLVYGGERWYVRPAAE